MKKISAAIFLLLAMAPDPGEALRAAEPNNAPSPPSMPVAAEGLITSKRIGSMLAVEAVTEAVKSCALQGYHVTAVLVDTDGVIQAQLRGDGASVHTLDSAYYKAFTAVSYLPIHPELTRTSEMDKDGPVNLWAKIPHLLQGGGGLLIRAGGEVVGAIGVGGGPGAKFDEGCGEAGLGRIRDRLR